jgi:hypothetical protein
MPCAACGWRGRLALVRADAGHVRCCRMPAVGPSGEWPRAPWMGAVTIRGGSGGWSQAGLLTAWWMLRRYRPARGMVGMLPRGGYRLCVLRAVLSSCAARLCVPGHHPCAGGLLMVTVTSCVSAWRIAYAHPSRVSCCSGCRSLGRGGDARAGDCLSPRPVPVRSTAVSRGRHCQRQGGRIASTRPRWPAPARGCGATGGRCARRPWPCASRR